MTARVLILSGAHLCHNPRVLKEATALSRHGLEVEVLGGWMDPALRARDEALCRSLPFRFTPVLDTTERGASERLASVAGRLRAKAANVACRLGGWESTWQLGQAAQALRAAALRSRADLCIAHNEAALPAARALLAEGRPVGIDMEDWYSEDLLPEARRYRPVRLLRKLERDLLRGCAHTSCTSQAMSVALAAEFGCREPVVVYNAFALFERARLDGLRKDRRDPGALSIHWYSQTLGPGRGLEDLFAALPLLEGEFEVHLRGRPVAGCDRWLAAAVPRDLRSRVVLHGLVGSDELLSRIAEHDIGFGGEMKYSRSRDLTVSNKMLQYLLAGLAVVASDTVGQVEVAGAAPGAVALYRSGDPADLAARINHLLGDAARLAAAKAAALDAASREFNWERQEEKLLASVASALR